MILLAAFKTLLHRCTGQDDIIVCTAFPGRDRPEFEGLIGFFVNTLVLRTDTSGNPSFRELLGRVREVCSGAFAHQAVPFEKLAEELQPEQDLSRTPLCQVFFDMYNVSDVRFEVPVLRAESLQLRETYSEFDLTLDADEKNEEIELHLYYNVDLFSEARSVVMLEQIEHLLEQVVANPDERMDGYSLVSPSTRPVLPNPTAPLDDTWCGAVQDLFFRQAERAPEKPAVVDPWESWSYGELDLRSNQLANYLLASGIEREDIVAIYAHRSASLVWALLGVLKAGAAFCILDPAYPDQRLVDYLELARPRGWLQIDAAGAPSGEVERTLNGLHVCSRLTLPGLESARVTGFLGDYSPGHSGVAVKADDLACVVFTSGSTGKPKGVMGRHGPLTHFLPWMEATFGFRESDRFSLLSGLSYNQLQREIFTALSLGARLCIPNPEEIGRLGRLDEWMRQHEISVVHLTPAMGQLLAETSRQKITSVRQVFFAGDLLRMHNVDSARELLPLATFANFYVASETQRAAGYTIISTAGEREHKEIPPLGRGIQDVQVLVLNQRQQMAGVGELGAIHIRSPHLARGYLGDEDLTQDRFISNPFVMKERTDRLFRTGESGRYLPDGNAEFAARAEKRINLRGFRIELGEIESVLRRHPAVRDAVVLPFGYRSARATAELIPPRTDIGSLMELGLAAYVVPYQGEVPEVSELRDYLLQRLPDYMAPSAVYWLQALPLTPNGKLDYQALPLPDAARP
jgi:amino acid adenylation domain-containing protein